MRFHVTNWEKYLPNILGEGKVAFFFLGGGGTKITYPRPYPNVALFTSFQYDDFPAFPFGGIWTNRSLESIVIY